MATVGFHTGQWRYRTFPSLQKFPLDSADLATPLIVVTCKLRPLEVNGFIKVTQPANIQLKTRSQISWLPFYGSIHYSLMSFKLELSFFHISPICQKCFLFQSLWFIVLIWKTGKLQWESSRAWIYFLSLHLRMNCCIVLKLSQSWKRDKTHGQAWHQRL